MDSHLIGYLALFVSVATLTFGTYFIIKGFKNYRSQIYLGLILVGLSVRIFTQSIFQLNVPFEGRYYLMILGSFQFAILPSVYLHLKSLLDDDEYAVNRVLLHFIPLLFAFLSLAIPTVIFEGVPKEIHDYSSTVWSFPGIISMRLLHVSFFFLGLYYLYKNFKLLLNAFSNGKLLGTHGKLIGQWALFVLFPLSMLFMLFLESFVSIILGIPVKIDLEPSLLIRTFFVSGILLFVFKNEAIQFGMPQLNLDDELENKSKISNAKGEDLVWIKSKEHENTLLGERVFQNQENIDRMIDKVDTYVRLNHPFRNPNFGLDELSRAVRIPTQHLRYVFKYHSKMGFVNYRNYFRMEDLIARLLSEEHSNYTLEALALEHGFGSHSVVLRTFKLHYNATPTEVIQSKRGV